MRRFKKGRLIFDLDDLMGQSFIIWNDKVYHFGWFSSWQISFALYQIKSMKIFKAVSIEK